MGEFHRAKHAYMVLEVNGKVMEGDPEKPTIPSIYKVRVSQVDSFREKFNGAGANWVPVYSMLDWTDSVVVKDKEKDDASPNE